jgi:hypothetical protein
MAAQARTNDKSRMTPLRANSKPFLTLDTKPL